MYLSVETLAAGKNICVIEVICYILHVKHKICDLKRYTSFQYNIVVILENFHFCYEFYIFYVLIVHTT